MIAALKIYLVAFALMETGRVKKRQVKPVRKEAGGQGRLKAKAAPKRYRLKSFEKKQLCQYQEQHLGASHDQLATWVTSNFQKPGRSLLKSEHCSWALRGSWCPWLVA